MRLMPTKTVMLLVLAYIGSAALIWYVPPILEGTWQVLGLPWYR